MFPQILYRQTAHKQPRFQLYTPGFNIHNGCWLEGSWVTVPKDEWLARKDAHQAMFESVRAEYHKQSYRDPAVRLGTLTEAKRIAYEHYSGSQILWAKMDGETAAFYVRTQANRLDPREVEAFRKNGAKILPVIWNAHSKEAQNALEGLDVPEDIVLDDKTPIDPWEGVVKRNKQSQRDFERGLLQGLTEGAPADVPDEGPQFMWEVAVWPLIEKEKEIIRDEWLDQQGLPNIYRKPLAELQQEYAEMRQEIRKGCGERFDALYERNKASHNECARANLDNCEGRIYSYVLPKFNEDGTHEPWGEKDVPWAHNTKV